MSLKSTSLFIMIRALFMLFASLLIVSAQETSLNQRGKAHKTQESPNQFAFPPISNYSRTLQEEGIQPGAKEDDPQYYFLSPFSPFYNMLYQNYTDYFKAIISSRDVQVTLLLQVDVGNADIFVSLDSENHLPNQADYTYSTLTTQTSSIELNEDDLNTLCESQSKGYCYLYVSVAPRGDIESATYFLSLKKTQQRVPRTQPAIFLEDSRELYRPVPTKDDSPEIFYFYTTSYEPSFVTVRCPGKAINIYAKLHANTEKKPLISDIHGPNNTNFDYASEFDEGSSPGLMQLTVVIPPDDDLTLVAVAVYFRDSDQTEDAESQSPRIYSILLTSLIMPIIQSKQYHEIMFSNQYQYYSFDVSKEANNFSVSIEASDAEDYFLLTIAAPNQKELPTGLNPLYQVKEKDDYKIIEVSKMSSIEIAGTWIIGVQGLKFRAFTLAVTCENNETISEKESQFMTLENGVTYTQHLAPAGLNIYLFYVNNLEEYFLTINSTWPKLKLYLSDYPAYDPSDHLWAFEATPNKNVQVLSLPGYPFYNNSHNYTTQWNGKENVKLKQKAAYLIVENPTSADIEFDVLIVSKERFWMHNVPYSLSLPSQATLPIILYSSGSHDFSTGITIEYIVNIDVLPEGGVLDTSVYFWDLDSNQVLPEARSFNYGHSLLRHQIYSLNNSYLIRQSFDISILKVKLLVLLKNPLRTPVNSIQVMMLNDGSFNSKLTETSYENSSQIYKTSLFLTPGIWYIWLLACQEPFLKTIIGSPDQSFQFETRSSNPEFERLYQVPTNASSEYYIYGQMPGSKTSTMRLQTAFYPLENITYNYTVKPQSRKIKVDGLAGTDYKKIVSLKFESLDVEGYDASSDSIRYQVVGSYYKNNISLCNSVWNVVQTITLQPGDQKEIKMSFELERPQVYRDSFDPYYSNRYYYTVFADILHHDSVVRSVSYQQEVIEFSDESSNLEVIKHLMGIIGVILVGILAIGLSLYFCWKRFYKRNNGRHELRPPANDNQQLRQAVDAEDDNGIHG